MFKFWQQKINVFEMQKNETGIFCPTSRIDWRQWLEENHRSIQSVWLVMYSKASAKPSIGWSEAVDEALCFGWIDSKKVSIDKHTSHQYFSKRKAKSTWSRINKEKVEKLITNGLMKEEGFKSIEIAKQNGSWSILDDIEELRIPDDLEKKFGTKAGAKDFFLTLSKSAKKAILQWLVLAKRPETRENRIKEIVKLAGKKQKPKQF